MDCGSPPVIANGYITPDSNKTTYPSTNYYYCREGYEMLGPNFITCQSNGIWDEVFTTCESEFKLFPII